MSTYWNWKLQQAKELEIKALHDFVRSLTDNITLDASHIDISQPQILAIHSRNVQTVLDKYAKAKEERTKIEEEMSRIFVETEEGSREHQKDVDNLHQIDSQALYESYLESKTDLNLRRWLKHLIQPYLTEREPTKEVYTQFANSKIISSD